MSLFKRFVSVSLFTLLALVARATETVPLASLDLTGMRQSYGSAQINQSIQMKPISLGGQKFEHGVGTHASSVLKVDLAGGSDSFHAVIGVDDLSPGTATVQFLVVGDGRKLFDSGIMRNGTPPKVVDVPLAGVKTLLLKVEDGGDGITNDHADWADARFQVSGVKPRASVAPREAPYILTPKPGPEPRLNSAKVYGCRPGNPFLFKIPATGTRPMQFSTDNLPPGIKLDAARGILSGTAPDAGTYEVVLRAHNEAGNCTRPFRIVSGDTLSLTPYMGWNHWYAHYDRVSDALIRRAADTMTSSGMADFGYSYVCIDDCWMNAPSYKDPKRVGPLRDADGNIMPNSYFPDMKGLTDYIHGQGLKAGIYTSPGTLTCTGFGGAYQHEAQDARRFAEWGFDLLKYDWCSYGKIAPKPNLEQMQKPYKLMGGFLKEQKRDIIYNLCQYGRGNVWEWGATVDAQSWRTAGDLGMELNRFIPVAVKNASHRAWNGPGSWNDPDYVQIGLIGESGTLKPSGLTPTEQYSFMSLWCLSAVPLMFSGDMEHLDDFTLNVLCNAEVLEIDQDPLGQCGAVSQIDDDAFLMVKDMGDGSKAVGLCNTSEEPRTLTAAWNVVGIQGRHSVRDVWRQKDLGIMESQFKSSVPPHGVSLVRITTAER